MDPCGLPIILAQERKAIANYLKTHHVTHAMREGLQVRDDERALYQLYSRVSKRERIGIPYFVCALRLWRKRFPIQPAQELDMNAL